MSLFNESEFREIIRDEVRMAIRELGKKPATAGEFVSVADAAQIASVATQTIRVWVREGRLTGYHAGLELTRFGGRFRYAAFFTECISSNSIGLL